jgi:hypothetical protein
MRTIVKFLAVVLISGIASGVFAQTSKTNDVAKLSEKDVFYLKKALSANKNLLAEDSAMVAMLLERNNLPLEYVIEEAGEVVEQSEADDVLKIYISHPSGSSYWLSYVVSRKNRLVGRLDTRLD